MSKRIFGSSCAIAFLLLCVHGPVNKEGGGKHIVNVLTAFEEQNGPWKPSVCLLLLSCMFLLSFLPFSPFSILFPSLPQFFYTLDTHPLVLLVLAARNIFSLSYSLSHFSFRGLFQSLCRNKRQGGFILFPSAGQLSACISSLPILLSHPRCCAFRKSPAVFLNAFSGVESVLGRFLCLLVLAKEAQLFIWHQLFKQNKRNRMVQDLGNRS